MKTNRPQPEGEATKAELKEFDKLATYEAECGKRALGYLGEKMTAMKYRMIALASVVEDVREAYSMIGSETEQGLLIFVFNTLLDTEKEIQRLCPLYKYERPPDNRLTREDPYECGDA